MKLSKLQVCLHTGKEKIMASVCRFCFHSWWYKSVLLFLTKRKRQESQSWSVFKCRRHAVARPLCRFWESKSVVSSSLHKHCAADMGVVRGVTEHGNWTSQTLKEASAGLHLMLPDLAWGTERKCCRTWRGHRPSWPHSACQQADCGRKEGNEREKRGATAGVNQKTIERGAGEQETEEERKMRREWPQSLRWLTGWHLSGFTPFSSSVSFCRFLTRTQTSNPLLHNISSLFDLSSLFLFDDPSVLPSLLHGQLDVGLIGCGVSGAAASTLQQNHLWQATNSSDRGEALIQTPRLSVQRQVEKFSKKELKWTEESSWVKVWEKIMLSFLLATLH